MKHETQLSLFKPSVCGDSAGSGDLVAGGTEHSPVTPQANILDQAFAEMWPASAQATQAVQVTQAAEHSPRGRRRQDHEDGLSRQPGALDRQRVQQLVAPSLEQLERLLSRLRSGSLVLALLAYGLRLPISALRTVRVRDVDPVAGAIVVERQTHVVPAAVADDLRELHQDRLSELKRSHGQSAFERRAQPLFTAESVERLYNEVTAWWATVQGASPQRVEPSTRVIPWSSCRILDRGLLLLGRRHLRAAQGSARSYKARGGSCMTRTGAAVAAASPLDLFDKGPRFVRRTYAGVVHAYYLWRARTGPQVGAVLVA